MNCKLCEFVLANNKKYQVPEKSLAYFERNFNKEELLKYMIWHQLTAGSDYLTVSDNRAAYLKFFGEFDDPGFISVTEMNRLLDKSDYEPFVKFTVAENMLQLEQMSYCTLLAMWRLKLNKTNKEHRRLSKYCELIEQRLDILTEPTRTKIKRKKYDTLRDAKSAKRTNSSTGIG